MKQKGIVPDYLFDRDKALREILKDLSNNESTYYKAILQNLFFATLNTPQKERGFRRPERYSRGYNPDFTNQYVYRYQSMFKEPDRLKEYFGKIPFLNGGLFECLDDGRKDIYIDGFTERSKKYQPVVPNFLFFSDETTVDLSKDYGEAKYRKAGVRGLINILKSYNFTIDENTPVDEEVALDPELLGKVFENLLASYNPETATTARKATGSYYTPREVVDYMVEESLKEYFVTTVPGIDRKRLDILFSYESDENPFNDKETDKLITAIHQLKIIDPAVGSGAFPMGILHRLVHILHKLDPHNLKWKEEQIKAVEQNVKDPSLRHELIQKIEESFALNELDYGRKLYLIQNCLYGVDIQPIAIQIAKLRFFISLLVDVTVDRTKKNFGIEPLPNLETKFVAGNTLIGLNNMISMLPRKLERINQFRDSLFSLRQEYFSTWDNEKKKEIKEQDKELRETMQEIIKDYIEKINRKIIPLKEELEAVPKEREIVTRQEKALFETITVMVDLNELKRQGIQNKIDKIRAEVSSYERLLESFQKIIEWDPYDTEHHANWFDPEWMFGVREGFDIVIGNPPYVRQEKIKSLKPMLRASGYKTFTSTADLYTYFYEQGYRLLKEGGILCFISSNKWMRAKYGETLREFLKKNTRVITIIDFGGYSVFEQTVDTNIILFQKTKPQKIHRVGFVNIRNNTDDPITQIKENISSIPQQKLSISAWTLADERVLRLKEKIERTGRPLKEWDVKIYFGIKTGFNRAFIIDTQKREEILRNCKSEKERRLTEQLIRPILRGRDIGRYYYRWADLWLIKIESGWTDRHRNGKKPEDFFKSTLPSIYEHLISFANKKSKGKGLLNRDDQGDYWWELRDCDYYSEFEKEKIIYPDISERLTFAFDSNRYFLNNTCYFITSGSKYLLGVLNSSLMDFYYKQISSQLGNEAIRAFTVFLEQLPIPPITPQNKPIAKKIEALVEEILSITQDSGYPQSSEKQTIVKDLEREIDRMVYKLYELTPEEIEIVEK
jgi:type I restriction-modification system DNA methylase subunit